jgi:tRNA(Ile)-lysidine synthase
MDPVTQAVRVALERFGLSQRRLLVAVSGGLDSTVLLHCVAALAAEMQLEVMVGHVNHGLRGEESDGDQAAVESLAKGLGVACRVARVDVGHARVGHSSRTRPTPQEAARNVRHEALTAMAREAGFHHIATAHHLDDQAETVLLRVIRGASVDGLRGITPSDEQGLFVRPVLKATRAELAEYALDNRLTWREDSSNASDRYTRNWLRHQVIPGLEKNINPRLNRALGRVAEAHERDATWIAGLVDDAYEARVSVRPDGGFDIAKRGWSAVPEALALRLVARLLSEVGSGRDLSMAHLERALAFLCEGPGAHGGREIELPGGVRLRREKTAFHIYRK